MNSESNSTSDDPGLNRVIATHLEAVEAGESPDRDALIAEHPDLANELQSFFANQDQMQAVVSDLDEPTIAPNASAEEATLPPSNANEEATLPPSGSEEGSPIGTKVRYFGDYELLEEIARGGMGVVYKARQINLNRIVALKMILSGQLASDEDVQRFYAEAEAAANLDHPGIVPIYEVGEHEGQHYFSMGYIEGESLADTIRDAPLSPRQAAEYVKKIAEAIAYAHERGVIHRDLKPANVLLDRYGEPKVTDFGLAKKVEGDSDLTATGQVLGTPSYMPPEQAAGNLDEIGPLSDVYSLGAVLYCLLTGRPPFQAASHLDVLMQVLDQRPLALRTLNQSIPRDLETICLKCLRKETHRRYGAAVELADDLGRWLNSEPIEARPVSRSEKGWLWCKRRPAIAGMMVLILVVIVVSTALLLLERRESQLRATRTAIDALESASGKAIPFAVSALKQLPEQMVLRRLQSRFQGETRGLPIVYALAEYGRLEHEFLIQQIGSARAEECDNIIAALSIVRSITVYSWVRRCNSILEVVGHS